MAKEWIDSLAEDIRQRNRGAAEEYGRAQHYAGIISTLGKEFFAALVVCLQDNVDTLRSRLQGDPTASETRLQAAKADEAKITRARFPWIDARVIHHHETITLDFAKGLGVAADPNLDRKSRSFTFRVAPDDTLFIEEAFAEPPRQFKQPEELGRHITEILFGA